MSSENVANEMTNNAAKVITGFIREGEQTQKETEKKVSKGINEVAKDPVKKISKKAAEPTKKALNKAIKKVKKNRTALQHL